MSYYCIEKKIKIWLMFWTKWCQVFWHQWGSNPRCLDWFAFSLLNLLIVSVSTFIGKWFYAYIFCCMLSDDIFFFSIGLVARNSKHVSKELDQLQLLEIPLPLPAYHTNNDCTQCPQVTVVITQIMSICLLPFFYVCYWFKLTIT